MDGMPPKARAAGGLDFSRAVVETFHYPFTHINAIGFHSHEPSDYVPK